MNLFYRLVHVKKISIINAYGHSNRGDSVLLTECISEIRSIYPSSIVNVLLFDDYMFESVGQTKKYNRLCNVRSSNKIFRFFNKLKIFIVLLFYSVTKFDVLLKLLPDDQKDSVSALANSDIIVSSPGGYIHDTNSAYYIALLHIFLCKCMSLPVILAPQSFGPINSNFGRIIAKYVLNKCDVICTRESYSKEFLLSLDVKPNLILECGDSAFWDHNVSLSDVDKTLSDLGINPDEKFLGMTLVNWTFPNQKDGRLLRQKYLEAVSSIINEVFEKYGLRTVVFNQVTDDLNISKNLIELCQNSVVIDEYEKDPVLLRGIISRSYVFLGTRFHSCIFALMSFVPTLAIAYLPKTEFILKDLNMEDRFFDINNLIADDILKKLFFEIENRDLSSDEVKKNVSNYQNTQKRLRHALELL